MNTYYYLAGPDGVGKTSYLKSIENDFLKKGLKTRHIWIRSPKIFSKPLMAYCRLIGLTKYKTIEGVRYGRHDFHKSKFVSWIFPILQFIDFKIKWKIEIRKIEPEEVILLDRFSIDTLADLMVDTQRLGLHKTKIGKLYLELLPKNIKIFFLHVDEITIRSRKKDTLHDEKLEMKIKVYEILAKDLGIKIIDNNKSFVKVESEIKNFLKNE